jgi:hypothetical protein
MAHPGRDYAIEHGQQFYAKEKDPHTTPVKNPSDYSKDNQYIRPVYRQMLSDYITHTLQNPHNQLTLHEFLSNPSLSKHPEVFADFVKEMLSKNRG